MGAQGASPTLLQQPHGHRDRPNRRAVHRRRAELAHRPVPGLEVDCLARARSSGFLVTAVFIVILARNVSVEQLVEAFRGADYRVVLPAAAVTLAGYILRSIRWQRIVRPAAQIDIPAAFSMLMMGFAANNLLPARLGEFVRAYLLRRRLALGRPSEWQR